MDGSDIIQYIQNELQRGVGKEDVKNSLLANGWSEQDIEDAFRAAAQPVANPIIPTAAQNAPAGVSRKPMAKKIAIILGVVIACLIVLLGAVRMLGGKAPANPSQGATGRSFTLPVPVKPGIVLSTLRYAFAGTIKEIRDNAQGKQLVLGINEPNLPQIVVSEKTKILRNTGNEQVPAAIGDLKSGIRVVVHAGYNPKGASWAFDTVVIQPPAQPQK